MWIKGAEWEAWNEWIYGWKIELRDEYEPSCLTAGSWLQGGGVGDKLPYSIRWFLHRRPSDWIILSDSIGSADRIYGNRGRERRENHGVGRLGTQNPLLIGPAFTYMAAEVCSGAASLSQFSTIPLVSTNTFLLSHTTPFNVHDTFSVSKRIFITQKIHSLIFFLQTRIFY